MDTIVGAGLAGLIAAHAWPNARIIESAPGPFQAHKALLRFRSDAVSRLTGIEFRKVTVRKGIWSRGDFCAPSIRLANLYSTKVAGAGLERSIWNIDPAERFIAPESFYCQLIDATQARISFGAWYAGDHGDTVSTAPLTVMIDFHALDAGEELFERKPIIVKRWKLPKTDLFQTVYYPDPSTALYRASITGDLLIAEFMSEDVITDCTTELMLAESFGINMDAAQPIEQTRQTFGKINHIDERVRKSLLWELTDKHQIYSLGRFATWRNILLDHVVDDIAAIKRLQKANTTYDRRKLFVNPN